MKKLSVLLILIWTLQACEDAVDVNLDTEEPRLVIEATGIQEVNNSTGIFQVKLSETAPYFQDSVPAVSGANIQLKIDGETLTIPESSQHPGIYQQQIPMIYEEDYELFVEVDEEEYYGKTQLYGAVPVDAIEQEEGLFGDDEVLLKIFYTDPADIENYYLFTYISKHGKDLIPVDDEHFDGNQVSTIYNEEFDPGDSIKIQINGTGKGFNRYITTLLDQGNSGNPFGTAPATVRGNMVNTTDADNFPLGYFRISQRFETVYIID